MPQRIVLINADTGEPKFFEPHHVTTALKSGLWSPTAGAKLPIITPTGLQELSGAEAFDAIQAGGTYPDNSTRMAEAQGVAAFHKVPAPLKVVGGAVDTALFGLPSMLASEHAEGLGFIKAARKDPYVTGGSILGAVAPIGAGGAITSLGKGVASAVAKKGGRSFLQSLAGNAVESAAWSLNQTAIDAHLGDPGSAWEHFIAGAGGGTVLGTGFQLVGKGAAKLGAKIFNKLEPEVLAAQSARNALFDSLNLSPSARGKYLKDSDELADAALNYVLPDGKPVIRGGDKIEQTLERLKTGIRTSGEEIKGYQQALKAAKIDQVIPGDHFLDDVAELAKQYPAEFGAHKAVWTRAEKLLSKRDNFSIDDLFTFRGHFKQAYETARAAKKGSLAQINQRFERIFDRYIDGAMELAEGTGKIAGGTTRKFREAKRIFSPLIEVERSLQTGAGKAATLFSSAKKLGPEAIAGVLGAGVSIFGDRDAGLDDVGWGLAVAAAFHVARARSASTLAVNLHRVKNAKSVFGAMDDAGNRLSKAISMLGGPVAKLPARIGVFTTPFYDSPKREAPATKVPFTAQAAARIREIRDLVNDPETMFVRLAANLSMVEDVSPQLANAGAAHMMRVASFLQASAPLPPEATNKLQPGLQPTTWQPNIYEATKWGWKVEAALNPLSVLEDAMSGRATVEGVETLKVLYPRLYEETTAQLITHLQSLKRLLTPQEKRQVELFLGIETDAGMIKANQEVYAQNKSTEQKGKSRASGTTNVARGSMQAGQGYATQAQGNADQ